MIYTLTLNPSIDYIVRLDDLKVGELNRTKSDIKLPGGKGINVSRIINNLGSKSIAMGFIGGFTGEFIKKWLDFENITTDFTTVKEDTRINVKVKSKSETEINGNGPNITEEDKENILSKIKKITKDDIVILSGSLPSSLSQDFYEEIVDIITKIGAEFVVDISGDKLLKILDKKPLLIKPNNHELEELFNVKLNSVDDIIKYGKILYEKGAKNIIISMGKDGAILINDKGTFISNKIKGDLKNSVGAGDSMVASFVAKYIEKKDELEAFKYSIAAGSATAFSEDLATKEFIFEILQKVKIERK